MTDIKSVMNFPVKIRPYKTSDTQAIIILFREAVHAIASKHYSPEQIAVWAPQEIDAARWQKSLEETITFVAEIDSTIVGFINTTREGYLDRLYIHKDYQGGRVSYALFKKIEATAKELGLTKITTDCSITAKVPAERMGFVVLQEQTVMRKGVPLINYKMEKILKI